jgi:hypothetical protein
LGQLPVQLRSAYILEITPREAPYSSRQRAVVYIDSEAYLELGLKASGVADEGASVGEVEVPMWQKIAQPTGTIYAMRALFYQGEVKPPSSLPAGLREQIRKDWNTSFWWVEPGHQTFNMGSVSEAQFSPQALERSR